MYLPYKARENSLEWVVIGFGFGFIAQYPWLDEKVAQKQGNLSTLLYNTSCDLMAKC